MKIFCRKKEDISDALLWQQEVDKFQLADSFFKVMLWFDHDKSISSAWEAELDFTSPGFSQESILALESVFWFLLLLALLQLSILKYEQITLDTKLKNEVSTLSLQIHRSFFSAEPSWNQNGYQWKKRNSVISHRLQKYCFRETMQFYRALFLQLVFHIPYFHD